MALLLTEASAFLITESGAQHLLIEPVAVTTTGFPSRFSGVAVIYKKSDFWEMDCGRGPVKSTDPDRLREMAKRLGAIRVEYEE